MANSLIANIWHRRILAEDQSYKNVPERWRTEVWNLLLEDVDSGKISASRFEELTGSSYPVSEEV